MPFATTLGKNILNFIHAPIFKLMKIVIAIGLSFIFTMGYSQAKIRKLSTSINNPSINVFAPYISFDGSTLLFSSDYADNGMLIYFSQRDAGDWKTPVELPKHLNTRLNLLKSYTLSPDGKTLYITSIKSGGVGGYDMWSSDFSRGGWSEIKNLYAPLNSKLHEGSPTFTTDGNVVYFMRCDKMDMQKADNCKILMSRKKNTGQWEEPVELPAFINTGNSQSPRIMADGETLIFSSDKLSPNKGGMDLYVTKLKDGVWTAPIPIETVNTEKDDQYVSAQANGRYLLKEAPGRLKSEIVEYLLPDEIRPRGVIKVEGTIQDASGAVTPSYISAVDLNANNKRVFNGRPGADGSFYFYLTEGSAYEVSIDPEESTYTYYSKVYDLTSAAPLRNDKIAVTLKPLSAGDELALDAIRFKPYSSSLDNATSELRRLSRLLKGASQFDFELHVTLSGYLEDSEKSDPDLTESAADSSFVTLEAIDSVGQLITRDSLIVTMVYHNDRTEKQANEIIDQLVLLGIDRKNISVYVNAKPEDAIENRITKVTLVVKAK